MKAYTLRMDEETLTALKQIGIKEHKTVKDIILDALQQRIHGKARQSQDMKEKRLLEHAAVLARKIPKDDILYSIHEDRQR